MALSDWLRYSNQGATRSMPLDPRLVRAMSFLPSMGVSMNVFSGGQPTSGPNRVGSHRHDLGQAGDVFFEKDGRRLDWSNPGDQPLFSDIVRQARAAGVTGFGAGPGYMQRGSMHLGFGSPAVWGAGGSSKNAPDWLRQAYGDPGVGPSVTAVPTETANVLASALVPPVAPGRADINALADTSFDALPGGGGSRRRDTDQPRILGGRQQAPTVSLETELGDTGSAPPPAPPPKLLAQLDQSMAPLAELFDLKTIGQAGIPKALPPRRRF
jgi:hypothetical protein